MRNQGVALRVPGWGLPQRTFGRRSKSVAIILVLCSYTALVLAMWAPFGPFSGMAYETTFALQSQSSSVLLGFLFGDPLRVHTNFFYHLAYLLSKALAIDGSWLAYQIVYALLWLGRGVLCFLIIHRLTPQASVFAYLVGALAIVHASDHALNWVGQMNQFGFIFWMLLSFLVLLYALETPHLGRGIALAGVAAAFSYMSLWSYEAQLPVILLAAVLLLFWRGRDWRRSAPVVALFLTPAAVYIALNAARYLHNLHNVGGEYQISLLRADMSAANLLNDLGFNLKYALAFWRWAELMPAQYATLNYVLAPLASGGAFLVGGIGLRLATADKSPLPAAVSLVILLLTSALLLIASFPAYLMLNSARWLWRTQLLAGPFAAVVLAAGVGLGTLVIGRLAPKHWRGHLELVTVLAFGAIVSFYGALASERIASFHFDNWERTRATLAGVLRVVPRVAPGSIVVLLDVPRKDPATGNPADPFGDNMWFDAAMKLAYPDANVTGYYFWPTAEVPPGNRFYSEVRGRDIDRLIVLRKMAEDIRLVNALPDELPVAAASSYEPSRRVLSGSPAAEARNRYLRFVAPWASSSAH